MSPLTDLAAWQALATHAGTMRDAHLRDLFAADATRFATFSRQRRVLYRAPGCGVAI